MRTIEGLADTSPLDFSTSTNPLGYPDCVKSCFQSSVDDVSRYPNPDKLTKSIAKRHDVATECILPSAGVADLIYATVSAFNCKIRVFAPTFTEYEGACRALKRELTIRMLIEDNGFRLDKPEGESNELVFFCNPNDPTGRYYDTDFVLNMIKLAKQKGFILFLGESFIDFITQDTKTIHSAVESRSVIIARSFSNFYAVPGLRIAYAIAHPALIQKLQSVLPPWSVNTLAINVGCEILKDEKYAAFSVEYIRNARENFINELRSISWLKVFPSEANFFLCKIIKDDYKFSSINQKLLKKGIIIRDCSNCTGLAPEKFFRIAVKKRVENMQFVSAVREI